MDVCPDCGEAGTAESLISGEICSNCGTVLNSVVYDSTYFQSGYKTFATNNQNLFERRSKVNRPSLPTYRNISLDCLEKLGRKFKVSEQVLRPARAIMDKIYDSSARLPNCKAPIKQAVAVYSFRISFLTNFGYTLPYSQLFLAIGLSSWKRPLAFVVHLAGSIIDLKIPREPERTKGDSLISMAASKFNESVVSRARKLCSLFYQVFSENSRSNHSATCSASLYISYVVETGSTMSIGDFCMKNSLEMGRVASDRCGLIKNILRTMGRKIPLMEEEDMKGKRVYSFVDDILCCPNVLIEDYLSVCDD